MGPFNNSELHDVSRENFSFWNKTKTIIHVCSKYIILHWQVFLFIKEIYEKRNVNSKQIVIKLHISHSSLSPQQCPFIKWTASAVLISACCCFSWCCWTWSDLNACLLYSLQWHHSPVFPTFSSPLSLFSIAFFFHSSSFGCMFSHVFESIIVHLHVSVVLQINAQDIHYQEQLGHGNGGTVYK